MTKMPPATEPSNVKVGRALAFFGKICGIRGGEVEKRWQEHRMALTYRKVSTTPEVTL
jgi:hypothetical protein